ncbi:MAG: hypothetical protein ABIA74_03850 [bacterium]
MKIESKIINSTFFVIFIATSLIITSNINSKNNSPFTSKISLISDAKHAIQEKLDSEKDIHMIIRTYELKDDKVQAQTKVHYTSYRKEPLCIFEEVNDLRLEGNNSTKFVYNKCKNPNQITQLSKKSKKQQFAFDAHADHA